MSEQTHDWKFYLTSAEAWEGMLAACESAKTSIDFEEFIFENDAVGARFAEVFSRKAREGVRVRLLIDMVGSFFLLGAPIVNQLRDVGVEVVFFSPVRPWKFLRFRVWPLRDHRKLMVVDRHVGFVGGVCVGEQYAAWRDTLVRIEGAIVVRLQEAFDHMWWTGKKDSEKVFRFPEHSATEDGFRLLTNAPHARQRFINGTFLDVMRNAKRSLYLTTPYFVPDRKFFRVLRLAARRGVDVRLLLPERSDHPYVDLASNAHFRKALKSGVRIYRYPKVMIHAKTMVVDDEWCSVGSANLDNLSSFSNYELNLTSMDRRFVEELRNQFLGDIAGAKEVKAEEWRRRPSVLKVLEAVCLPFGRFF